MHSIIERPSHLLAFAAIALSIVLIGRPAPSVSQDLQVSLVQDLAVGDAGASIEAPVDVDGSLYFSATTPDTGAELYRSDGSASGISLVKDILPGSDGSNPSDLTAANGVLFFEAALDTTGRELWTSDGSSEGTHLVADLNPAGDGAPDQFTEIGGTLFMAASDSANGRELWSSDGTESGTAMVADINPDGSSSPGHLTAAAGKLFFSADDGTNGEELWVSDGTESGTAMVADINPGGESSPFGLTTMGSNVYFRADDGMNGNELWVSDGTEAGTRMVSDINPSGDSFVRELTPVDATLFFSADDGENGSELWASDGTESGTRMVRDISFTFSNPTGLTAVGDRLYFAADDGVSGNELWTSDGTESGTRLVRDINEGFNSSLGVSPVGGGAELYAFEGTLYFRADNGSNGYELWTSDGTESGTVMVEDVNPGAEGSNPRHLTGSGGALFFEAFDGTHGTELWIGEAGDTNLIACSDLQLEKNVGEPLDRVELSGLPTELSEPLAAEVSADGVDSDSLYAFALRDSFVVPLHPSVSADGGDVQLRFRGNVQRCENAVDFTIEPLPPAAGAAVATLDSLEAYARFKAELNGVDVNELRTAEANELPRIVWPIAIAQRLIDEIRPELEQAEGAGKNQLGDTADRLIQKLHFDDLALAAEDEITTMISEAEQVYGTVENLGCVPSLVTTAKQLNFCMNLQERGQIGLDDPSIYASSLARARALRGYAVAAVSNFTPSKLDRRIQAALAVAQLTDILLEAPVKLAPNRFTDMEYEVSKEFLVEDEVNPGKWTDAFVRASSSEWKLDSAALSLLLTFEPVGDKLKGHVTGYLPDKFENYAGAVFDLIKSAGTDTFTDATEGEGSMEIPATQTAPIEVTDEQWTNVEVENLRQDDRFSYLPDDYPLNDGTLLVETRSGLGSAEFPDYIGAERTIPVHPIDVTFSTITNLETGSVVPKDPTPIGCPGSNPTELMPDTRYEIEVSTVNATNADVNLFYSFGSISDVEFDQFDRIRGEKRFVFEAPAKPSTYMTFIEAFSKSKNGLRSGPDAPHRADNLSIRIGENLSDSECDPPTFPPVADDAGSDLRETGGVYGHPHFKNFARTGFDFQAVGEFILVRSVSQNDDFEVQLRLLPISGQYVNLTIATAVAMNVAGDRVVIDSGEDVPLRVNGSPTEIPRGDPLELPQSGVIYQTDRGLTADWPNGEYRVETLVNPDAQTPRIPNVHVFTAPSEEDSLGASLDGLIGGFQTRDSTGIDPTSFEQLYDVFGEDWRITQQESLFGTATFADRSYPADQFTVDDLSDERREEARQTCEDAGITDEILLQNCILDVGTTGDSALADDAANLTIAPPDSMIEVQAPLSRPSGLQYSLDGNEVDLVWTGVDDPDVERYLVYRESETISGMPSEYMPIDSVSTPDTTYTDTDLQTGRSYYYRITARSQSGVETGFSGEAAVELTGTADDETLSVPETFALGAVYPNPFETSATITVDVPRRARIEVSVYDVVGQRVADVTDRTVAPGHRELKLNASGLSSGVYVVVLRAGERMFTEKVVVVR